MTIYTWDRQTDTLTKHEIHELIRNPKLIENIEDQRRVGSMMLPGFWISTVFLGIDHNWSGGPPICFETMIFPKNGNLSECYMTRYHTGKEAKAGHDRVVRLSRWLLCKAPQISFKNYSEVMSRL